MAYEILDAEYLECIREEVEEAIEDFEKEVGVRPNWITLCWDSFSKMGPNEWMGLSVAYNSGDVGEEEFLLYYVRRCKTGPIKEKSA